ncbi:MAG: hypothetical protein ACI9G1_002118, partial [Pirellulaceae bacterium]
MARLLYFRRHLTSVAIVLCGAFNYVPHLVADDAVAAAEGQAVGNVLPFGLDLIERLGSDDFAVRRSAEETIVKEGKKCSVALNDALLNSPDLHVQRRCRWLLDLIVDREFDGQLKAFKAGADIDKLNFPTWENFRDRFGSDKESAQLFVEMVTAERPLLESYASGPEVAAKALVFRISQIRSRMYVGD